MMEYKPQALCKGEGTSPSHSPQFQLWEKGGTAVAGVLVHVSEGHSGKCSFCHREALSPHLCTAKKTLFLVAGNVSVAKKMR